jgi:hypothetical protein
MLLRTPGALLLGLPASKQNHWQHAHGNVQRLHYCCGGGMYGWLSAFIVVGYNHICGSQCMGFSRPLRMWSWCMLWRILYNLAMVLRNLGKY